jgi:hypothetical protein
MSVAHYDALTARAFDSIDRSELSPKRELSHRPGARPTSWWSRFKDALLFVVIEDHVSP